MIPVPRETLETLLRYWPEAATSSVVAQVIPLAVLSLRRYVAESDAADSVDLAALREELATMAREFEAGQQNWVDGMKRLADAERRNSVMADLLRLIRGSHGTVLLTDPPQDPWKYHQIAAKIDAALQPTESGASE